MPALRYTIGILIACSGVCASWAADGPRGNADEARALLTKASAFYKEAGREAALSEFNNRSGKFVDRDLYIFCSGPDQKISAHGSNSALIGKEIAIFKDADGLQFAAKLNELAQASGKAELEYRWVNPVSKKIETKSSIAEVFGADICGVGYYK
jgi:cytochrome c